MSSNDERQKSTNQQRQLPAWSIKLLDAGVILALFTALLFVGGYARLESFYGQFGIPGLAREVETKYVLVNSLSTVGFLTLVLSILFAIGAIVWFAVAWIRHKGPPSLQRWLSADAELPGPVCAFIALIVGLSVLGITVTAGHASGEQRAAIHALRGPYVTLYDTNGTAIGSFGFLESTPADYVVFPVVCNEPPGLAITFQRELVSRRETLGTIEDQACRQPNSPVDADTVPDDGGVSPQT